MFGATTIFDLFIRFQACFKHTISTKTNSSVSSLISYGSENVSVIHPLHLLQLSGILKWDTISHMYKALTLMVVPVHGIEVLVNWFSTVCSRLRCVVSWLRSDLSLRPSFFLVMTKSDLKDMGGLKTCYVTFSSTVRLTDPGMVDPSTFMVDMLMAFSADDPTKLMGLVPLVDALLLSNPRPILQLDDF
ncbi:hypothetical protein Tco_0802449 [Tanacetum coccineum]|uniref:Uncharacterized protein n=1 Tax=Tanacetum coccineum TaxID=301880 RepID=A0ABQ5A1R5_9ASTR